MKKVLLTSIIASILLSSVGCSVKNDMEVNNTNRSIILEDDATQTYNSIDQKKALRLYKKYLPKVIKLFESKGMSIKNLNENKEETDMVSRIVVGSYNDLEVNYEPMWFGITYDDDNLISEVGMYIEYPINIDEIDADLSFKNTMLQDIENLFFKNESFLNDIKTTVCDYKIDDISEINMCEYKKGKAEISMGQHKINIKINLNLKEYK